MDRHRPNTKIVITLITPEVIGAERITDAIEMIQLLKPELRKLVLKELKTGEAYEVFKGWEVKVT